MRIDEIAANYCREHKTEHLSMGDLDAMHAIYEEYKKQKTYRGPETVPHPRDVLHAVSRALARSDIFETTGKIPTCWGLLNCYTLK